MADKGNKSEEDSPIPFDEDLFDRIQDPDDPATFNDALESILDGVLDRHIKTYKSSKSQPIKSRPLAPFFAVDLKNLVSLPSDKTFPSFKAPQRKESIEPQMDSEHKEAKAPSYYDRLKRDSISVQTEDMISTAHPGHLLDQSPTPRTDAIRSSQRDLDVHPQSKLLDPGLDSGEAPTQKKRSKRRMSGKKKKDPKMPDLEVADSDAISDRYKDRQKSIQEFLDTDKGTLQ